MRFKGTLVAVRWRDMTPPDQFNPSGICDAILVFEDVEIEEAIEEWKCATFDNGKLLLPHWDEKLVKELEPMVGSRFQVQNRFFVRID